MCSSSTKPETMTRTSSASFIHSGHLKQRPLLSSCVPNSAALFATVAGTEACFFHRWLMLVCTAAPTVTNTAVPAAVTHAACFGSRSGGFAMAIQAVQHLVHGHALLILKLVILPCMHHQHSCHDLQATSDYHTPAVSKPGTCRSQRALRTTLIHQHCDLSLFLPLHFLMFIFCPGSGPFRGLNGDHNG
eukprot:1146307-Pelagomonas_calceolata.AAC.1